MRAASTAAFFALSTPTVATGTPGGICTIESSASSPSSTDIDERSGTPITGSSVCAATTPGQRRGEPRAADQHLQPAPGRALRVLGDGVRRAVRGADVELPADPARVELVHRAPACARGRTPSRSGSRRRLSHLPPPRCPAAPARPRTRRGRPPRTRARAPRRRWCRVPSRRGFCRHSSRRARPYRRAAVEDERAGRFGGVDPFDRARPRSRCARGSPAPRATTVTAARRRTARPTAPSRSPAPRARRAAAAGRLRAAASAPASPGRRSAR